MKTYHIIIFLALINSGLYSQGIYNNGAKMVIGSGAYFNITGKYQNETNVTDGGIILNGTLKLEGDYVNNASSDVVTPGSTGTVELAGTAHQSLSGTSAAAFGFINMIINNPAGVSLLKEASIAGSLTLTNGLFDIGTHNLLLLQPAIISGIPGITNMIVATGSGELRKEYNAASSFVFPVGDNTFSVEYSPVTLNITAGTFAPGAYIGLNLVNGTYNDPSVTGSYLNRYWNISQSGITAFTCDAMFQYTAADVVGTESAINCTRIFPAPSSTFNAADITLHQLSATGIDLFGTFTGSPGNKILNIKIFLEGLYNGSGTMRQAQGIAGNQFPGTTADQITIELHSSVPGQYASVIFSAQNTDLSTSGQASVKVPIAFNGSYYITVRGRNSITTVSGSSVSFTGNLINYDFSTSAAQAYGNNMRDVGGVFVIYGGDIDTDGSVGIADMGLVDNASAAFTVGYVPEDADGDGSVGIADMGLIDNNSANFVSSIIPL